MFISDIYLENDSSDSCLDFGESVEDSNEEDISTDDSPPPTVDSKYDRATFLLRTSHTLSLNYSSIDELCESTQILIEQTVEKIQEKILCDLQENGISTDDTLKSVITDSCQVGEIFSGLSSRAQREQYYRSTFNYVVS